MGEPKKEVTARQKGMFVYYICLSNMLHLLRNTSTKHDDVFEIVQSYKPIYAYRLEKKALANSVDPDETPHDAASHQGLRCLLKGISNTSYSMSFQKTAQTQTRRRMMLFAKALFSRR
ncbi:hypothetical protein DPMN_077995 [Dreissena polymorpha]|uniref:Uncharacterized protein n=1 Tax=Dreissena polymorpha TaxID=45954 RepID=A0A9D3YLG7_DREPO|nr:hypothetical protein DPMN_077995 [Dreissena polymorpha]